MPMRYPAVAFLLLIAPLCHRWPRSAAAQDARTVSPEAMQRALDDFKLALDERWSYRHANGADFDGAIRALRKKVEAGISSDELGLELQKIIALGIDGHAGVSGYTLPGAGYLPFLVEPEGERFVAFNRERTAFLANGFPYVTKIDGRDMSDWCAAASVLVPKGSPQYVRRRCLTHLGNLDFMRGLMSLPKGRAVEVALATRDGKARRTLTLALADTAPSPGIWPGGGSRMLDGGIGYLRLPNMIRATSVDEIKRWMPRFRETIGLIVDVRDNNGGERDALRLLYSYLAAPGDPPRVINAAAYRLHPDHKDDHLASNHSMYRAEAKEWTDEERQAIAAFAKVFKPEWELPKGQFSAWHYMILRRLDDPEVFSYQRPVVVLLNQKCFSATDIFLAGLKGMRNVTLLGTASSGGSAYGREVVLGATGIAVRIGSMASFQLDGRLFDGNGVRPDVVVEPAPEYYIGGPDAVLAEAMTRIIKASR
jgi:Peptidase family S41